MFPNSHKTGTWLAWSGHLDILRRVLIDGDSLQMTVHDRCLSVGVDDDIMVATGEYIVVFDDTTICVDNTRNVYFL